MNRLYDTNKLHQYYSGPSYELTNVSGQSQGYYDSNVLLFNQQNQKFQVFLLGKDENKYKENTWFRCLCGTRISRFRWKNI